MAEAPKYPPRPSIEPFKELAKTSCGTNQLKYMCFMNFMLDGCVDAMEGVLDEMRSLQKSEDNLSEVDRMLMADFESHLAKMKDNRILPDLRMEIRADRPLYVWYLVDTTLSFMRCTKFDSDLMVIAKEFLTMLDSEMNDE